MRTKVDISYCIATHNMKHTLHTTVSSILEQVKLNNTFEIVIYDDASTDGTNEIEWFKDIPTIKYIYNNTNVGVGEGFNRAISYAKGTFVMLMCADDFFADKMVTIDMLRCFADPTVGHVTRWYYQFVDGYRGAVRAWRGNNPMLLANNPSGLMFRRKALEGCSCSNKMFVETTHLVHSVLDKGWNWVILNYDAIAVRVHRSTSTQSGYWLKRRVSSPVLDQTELGAAEIATDFVSLIQIKRGFVLSAVIEEIANFVKVRPINLLSPRFWFWSIVALLIPRKWAVALPEFYRHRIGRLLTKRIERN